MKIGEIEEEIEVLNGVSSRLEKLSDEHPLISDGLLRIAGIIRNASVLLLVIGTKGDS
jgi:hypothetical protein